MIFILVFPILKYTNFFTEMPSTLDDLFKALKENEAPGSRLSILPYLRRQKPKYDFVLIRLAYDYAAEAHKGQERKSGEAYITHPLETAIILAKMGMDQDSIIAGLLHDVPEDTNYNLVDVEKNFGPEVAKLVAGVTKLGVIKYRGIERYAENLRKMFVSMAQDIRIILIKMADRLHNLSTLDSLPPEKQKRIAQESLEIYAPIANRLGMGSIRGQLEDSAFPYVYPEEYRWMQKEIIPQIQVKVEYTEKVIEALKKELNVQKIKTVSIHGRIKRIYSLYQKLIREPYNRDFSKIYDTVAVRIIVPTVSDCYQVLGVIHNVWRPLAGRVKDYIAQPKPNGYQSLHSTVFCIDGQIVEFQIRTPRMHAQAEFGVASHWQYKEFGVQEHAVGTAGYSLSKKMKWIEDLVHWQRGVRDNEQYLQSLSIDFFQHRIFVFTPRGDVIDLPHDATPIDFAYHVHTWIGDHCTGALINNHMSSLDSQLKNGDVIEIITDKNRKGPSQDWLNFVKTNAAKGHIRGYHKQHRYQ